MADELTPMMRQYMRIKSEVPSGAIVMFRLGDFYEIFGEDAIIASPILGATLTKRAGTPMCGVPHHALDTYLAKLIRAGKTAALCDQTEDPKLAKGLVRREVTRIVTPGTVTEDGLLDETVNNYIASVSGCGIALMDLSTGELQVEQVENDEKLVDTLRRYSPAEVLVEKFDDDDDAAHKYDELRRLFHVTDGEAWTFSLDAAKDELQRHFNVLSLDGFGIEGKGALICAAGALLYYVSITLRHKIDHVRSIRLNEGDNYLSFDSGTIRHLALLPGDGVTREASLLGILNVTRTPMGARRLASWIRRPLCKASEINARLDAVEFFTRNRMLLGDLRQKLTIVRDIERLIAKVDAGRANPRDVRVLADSLRNVPDIRSAIGRGIGEDDGQSVLKNEISQLKDEPELVDTIDRAIVDQPNVILTEGNIIRDGFNAELDELKSIVRDGVKWLGEYQVREQERTGIKTLRVRRNGVFGIYIEISKGLAHLAPPEYERRQTLTTCERFTTAELKEYEAKALGAEDKLRSIEAELFRQVVAKIAERTLEIQRTSHAIGDIDAILSLADRALAAGYVRPVVDDSDVITIEDGRHPIIEQLPDAEPFVPNSTDLNCSSSQIMLITGPNMAGKSTYIRQVATLVIMAQAGSFVAASAMRLGAIDRIFTRIGAGDDFSRGRSTFLVEMQETANILNNATPKSLIVLDEIGRGTSTFDGISIAWSVAEYLHENKQVKAKTLFATHYHELTDLAERFPGVKNFTVRVKEDAGRVIFLRRIVPGSAEKSFGIHVAAMAGLPKAVVKRADDILKNLEANDLDVSSAKIVKRPRKKLSDLPGQLELGF